MLYAAIFDLLGATADREGLVALLASHYPSRLLPGGRPVEAYVASLGVEEILIATDTYDKGPTFRRDVEWAVSRGFSEAAVVGKKDVALVKSTLEWFNRHRGQPRLSAALIADPILIVTDAYSKSKIAAVRTRIAKALRFAFTGLGVAGRDDNEFVANAAKSYAEQKDRLDLDLYYAVTTSEGGTPRALFRLSPPTDGPH
jgi:hypothetical protein